MLRAPPAQENLRRQQQLPSTAANFIAGTVAAVGATLLTQPADVVRTRVQLGLAVADWIGHLTASPGTLSRLTTEAGHPHLANRATAPSSPVHQCPPVV